jgi:hypothetical protein
MFCLGEIGYEVWIKIRRCRLSFSCLNDTERLITCDFSSTVANNNM